MLFYDLLEMTLSHYIFCEINFYDIYVCLLKPFQKLLIFQASFLKISLIHNQDNVLYIPYQVLLCPLILLFVLYPTLMTLFL